jgi:hypothetical protein
LSEIKGKVDEIEEKRKRDHEQVLNTFEEMPTKLSRHI